MRTLLNRSRFGFGILPLVLIAGIATQARADLIGLGTAGQYVAFGLGSQVQIGTTNETLLGNTAEIYGNVGVGAGNTLTAGGASPYLAGVGDFQKGFIVGNLNVDGSFTGSAGYANWSLDKNFGVTGNVNGSPSPCTDIITPGCGGGGFSGTGAQHVDGQVTDAINGSAFYNSLGGSAQTVQLNSQNLTLNSGVYRVTDFDMNSGSQLTINGVAGSQFIMNISGDFSFAKSFIRLTGGIRSEDVLFNVIGTGLDAQISGDNSVFFGTLLAVSRNILIQGIGSQGGFIQGVSCGADNDCTQEADNNPGLEGRVIGALGTEVNNPLLLKIYSGAELNAPTTTIQATPEPGTLGLAASGLIGLVGFVRFRRRQG